MKLLLANPMALFAFLDQEAPVFAYVPGQNPDLFPVHYIAFSSPPSLYPGMAYAFAIGA